MKKIFTLIVAVIVLTISSKAITITGSVVNIIEKSRHLEKRKLNVLPDRATNGIKIMYVSTKTGAVMITLYNANGTKLSSEKTIVKNGENQIAIKDFKQLKEGSYTIQLTDNIDTYSSGFMVWK